jgi:hypothetical protein
LYFLQMTPTNLYLLGQLGALNKFVLVAHGGLSRFSKTWKREVRILKPLVATPFPSIGNYVCCYAWSVTSCDPRKIASL